MAPPEIRVVQQVGKFEKREQKGTLILMPTTRDKCFTRSRERARPSGELRQNTTPGGHYADAVARWLGTVL